MSADNAIILAAGCCSRFVPVCFDIPKGLIPIRGETLIERQIRQLHEKHVFDITVVTGALADRFDFLSRKWNVRLIYNPDYATKNNFASLLAAKEWLGDTIITSSDLYFPRNIFRTTCNYPYYASVFAKGKTSQRTLALDENSKIVGTSYGGADAWITFGGHARLSADISRKLLKCMSDAYDNPAFSNRYWVDFQDDDINGMPMYAEKLQDGAIVEFNTLESLRLFDPGFRISAVSPTMRRICSSLNVDEEAISGFEAVKEKNKAVGCEFDVNGKRFCYMRESDEVISLDNK